MLGGRLGELVETMLLCTQVSIKAAKICTLALTNGPRALTVT